MDTGERAGQVDLDDPVPALGRDVEDRGEGFDPGAGDEDLDRAELLPDALEPGLDRRPVADVGFDGKNGRAPASQLVGGGLRPLVVDDGDAMTVVDEGPGHAETDSRAPAGDDGDAAHRLASGTSNWRWSRDSPRRRIQVGSYRKCRAPGGPWCSSERRMFLVRSRMRSMLMRPSAPQRQRAPGQEWAPRPKATWDWTLGRSARNSRGTRSRRGSRLAAPFSSMTGVPAVISTPPMEVVRRASRKSVFTGLSTRKDLFEEVGDPVAVCPQLVLELRVLGQVLQGRREQPRRRLLPGGEQERRGSHYRGDIWRRTVWIGGESQIGEDVMTRFAPAVLDVLGEPLVEPGERILTGASLFTGADFADGSAEPEAFAEPLVVLFRHPEQIGDHQHRERLGVGGDELATAVTEELVELFIGQPPDERLVVLQPLRGDESHQQPSLTGVLGRVHGHHVLVHGQLVPVAVDDVTDVITFQGYREGGERPDHRVARGERLAVPVDLGRLVVSGHRHDAEVGEREHRALRAQLLEVRVRIFDQRLVEEEVGRLPVAQPGLPLVATLRTRSACLSNCIAHGGPACDKVSA